MWEPIFLYIMCGNIFTNLQTFGKAGENFFLLLYYTPDIFLESFQEK